MDGDNDYMCLCAEGWVGHDCSISKHLKLPRIKPSDPSSVCLSLPTKPEDD